MSDQPVDVDVDEPEVPAESDDSDVEYILEGDSDSGSGDLENLPPSDFDGFAADDVEEEEL